jgi:hypothetical protein
MVLSDELSDAARHGLNAPLAQITDYLDTGGDPNDVNTEGQTMLQLIMCEDSFGNDDDFGEAARLNIVRLLLARGANVHKMCDRGFFPLYQACNCQDLGFGLGAIRCLLDAGANIDQKTSSEDQVQESALSTSLDWLRYDGFGWDDIGLSYVSLLLRYGADLDECWGDRSAEDCLRHIEDPAAFPELEGEYGGVAPAGSKEGFRACKSEIADERRRRFVAKRKEVLRLRSLVARGRAKKSSDAMIEPSFRLPDGVLWNVLSFWPPRGPKTFWRARAYDGPLPGCVFTTRGGLTGYWVDDVDSRWITAPAGYWVDAWWTGNSRLIKLQRWDDYAWESFAHERLPKMSLTALKTMLATLKPLAKDAYIAAMAAREDKSEAAARKVVRALFEHIPRDAILDAYAQAMWPLPHALLTAALAPDYRGPGYLPGNGPRS